jgi:hypothetical protein
VFDKDGKPSFYRPVLLINEGVKTDVLAEHFARRELTNRNKGIESWEVETDGLSYYDGNFNIEYGVDTCAEVETSLAGGPAGAYLVIRTIKTRNSTQGDTSRVSLLKKGLWTL